MTISVGDVVEYLDNSGKWSPGVVDHISPVARLYSVEYQHASGTGYIMNLPAERIRACETTIVFAALDRIVREVIRPAMTASMTLGEYAEQMAMAYMSEARKLETNLLTQSSRDTR